MLMRFVPLQTTFLAFALLALAGPDSPVLAQPSAAETAAIRQNCRSDFMAKCMSVKPGGIEAFQCLKKNEAALSAACRSAVNAVAAEQKPAAAKPAVTAPAQPAPVQAAPATATAPTAPAATAKPAAKPAATKSVPPKPVAPKPAVTAAPAPANTTTPAQGTGPAPRLRPLQEARLVREFCTTDYQVLCKGVRLGEGRALKCLSDNQPSLSPGCKQAMGLTGR